MATTELTGKQLREAVYELIARELGTAALARFVQENYQGLEDYTADRAKKPQPTVDEIIAKIQGNAAPPPTTEH